MTDDELAAIAAAVNEEIQGITRARAALRGIHAKLEDNASHPFEQDYIYAAHYGSLPAEPRTKTINGITITTRILHQTGARLSDINGADLLYEIPRRKFVVIQYKRADSNGRIPVDDSQLDDLIANCPASCERRARNDLRCGSWYAVIHQQDARILSACNAREVFDDGAVEHVQAFAAGLRQATFDEMFGKCYLGAPVSYGDIMGQVERAINTHRMLFSVVERDWRVQ